MIDDDNNGGPNRRGSWMRGIGILLMLPIGLIAVLVDRSYCSAIQPASGASGCSSSLSYFWSSLSSASRTDVQEGGIGGSSTGVRMDR